MHDCGRRAPQLQPSTSCRMNALKLNRAWAPPPAVYSQTQCSHWSVHTSTHTDILFKIQILVLNVNPLVTKHTHTQRKKEQKWVKNAQANAQIDTSAPNQHCRCFLWPLCLSVCQQQDDERCSLALRLLAVIIWKWHLAHQLLLKCVSVKVQTHTHTCTHKQQLYKQQTRSVRHTRDNTHSWSEIFEYRQRETQIQASKH